MRLAGRLLAELGSLSQMGVSWLQASQPFLPPPLCLPIMADPEKELYGAPIMIRGECAAPG